MYHTGERQDTKTSLYSISNLKLLLKGTVLSFPVDKSLPAKKKKKSLPTNAGDTSLIPDLGRPHTP